MRFREDWQRFHVQPWWVKAWRMRWYAATPFVALHTFVTCPQWRFHRDMGCWFWGVNFAEDRMGHWYTHEEVRRMFDWEDES